MGFGHSAIGIQQLCVELGAVIHANFHVAATIPPNKRSSSLYKDFDEHFEEVINTKSIELAVNLRALFDRCASLSNPHPLPQATRNSLALTMLVGKAPLTVRECANKIIHAGYFLFRYGRYSSTGPDGVTFSNQIQESTVELAGWHHKEQWRCTLDLLIFAEEAHLAAKELQSAWQQ